MNRNEFEDWMKGKIEEEPYLPTEDMWRKLQQDLQPPVLKTKKMLFIPILKAAASLFLILSIGVAFYYLNDKKTTEQTSPSLVKKTSNITSQKIIDKENVQLPTPPSVTITRAVSELIPNHNTTTQKHNLLTVTKDSALLPVMHADYIDNKGNPESSSNVLLENNERKQIYPKEILYPTPTDYFKEDKKDQHTNIGIAANIGKPSVGNLGYQIGVVSRTHISNKIFVEATLAMASTAVNYSQQHSFPSANMGSDGLDNSFETSITNINANYAKNVISLGVTPVIGIKISRNLSVSGGGALYRNLNPSLGLTNKNEIESVALTNDIISNTQKVSNWDIGLTGNADYKITTQLSFNANYRQGLSNYLHYNNKYYKNSGFNIGLKYVFGK